MNLSNNTQRVLVAAAAIPLILAASYFGSIYFMLLILIIAFVSFFEFHSMVKNKGMMTNIFFGFAGIAFLVINQSHYFFDFYSFTLLFIVFLTGAELFRKKGSAIYNISATLLGTIYLGLLAGALISIREFYPKIGELYLRGGYLIITLLASIWICDTAAFYGGRKFGKHKLFLRVSPNKSWEGAIFGFFFAIITSILAKILFLHFISFETALAIGFIVGTVGQIGDLIESLLKRDSGIKDSSKLIPGHGGVFDRFDSLLYSAPVILLYLKYLGR
ncbi:MAG TPA: phosphatidate cytidylyltransferase [Ignavibacteriaceae bacterium]|nr:phosphatidate cytidylyltransferase [Ignavibacteriaceae bacterium]